MDSGVIVVIWLLSAILGAVIGGAKGRPGTGFALGLLLGLIGVIIIAVMSPSPEKQAQTAAAMHYAYLPTQASPNITPPGWHADPMERHQLRYWDGQRWTNNVSNNGVPTFD